MAASASLAVNVEVSTSDDTVGTITSPFPFTGNQSRVTGSFTPIGAGSAELSITQPEGFEVPANRRTTLTATVRPPNISISDVRVGKDLHQAVSITLQSAPPSPVDVTVTSSSASIATVSKDATAEGIASVTFSNASSTFVGRIFIQGRSLGGTTVTAQAPGYSDGISNVTVHPSGFYIAFPGDFTTDTSAANTRIRIRAGRLNPTTLNLDAAQAVRGGLTVEVGVTSSDTSVGTITTSPLEFNSDDFLQDTFFDPESVGTTDISVGTPPGFNTSSNFVSIRVTVNP